MATNSAKSRVTIGEGGVENPDIKPAGLVQLPDSTSADVLAGGSDASNHPTWLEACPN